MFLEYLMTIKSVYEILKSEKVFVPFFSARNRKSFLGHSNCRPLLPDY